MAQSPLANVGRVQGRLRTAIAEYTGGTLDARKIAQAVAIGLTLFVLSPLGSPALAQVDDSKGKGTITFDPARVRRGKIIGALEWSGFKPIEQRR